MSSISLLNVFDSISFSWKDFHSSKVLIPSSLFEYHTKWMKVALTASSILCTIYLLHSHASYNDNIPTVNRRFALEPRIFVRLRWAFGSVKILDDAYEKYHDRAYRLARGDADIIVLPSRFINELNRLPQHFISSRKSHSKSLTGYLNGMDVVQTTNHHVKMLLSRPASQRIQSTITELFPRDTDSWNAVEPVNKIVHCISQAITLSTFGPPICDNPKLPILVWLLPYKWRLEQSWKNLEDFVVPEVESRKADPNRVKEPNLISWMLAEAKTDGETDGYMLTRLVGSVIAGGTYSSAAFVTGVIADLIAHPHFLDEIREEIRQKNDEVQGNWDQSAFNNLDKLDSAMKETSRLAPGSLLVYSRVMENDCTLSNGLELKKGQLITTSGHSASMDPNVFPNPEEYDALRAYNQDFERHRAQPFRSVEGEDHRWGAGRWACPGRYIASIVSKIILVKLLDEYDFEFVGGKRPKTSVMHEFVFIDPATKIMMRRKKQNSGIMY
ncbi:cytochrome P450 [Zopfia rhizophila CBS 207.26]|uniref:Cytochrome P450 n=1 Tax=Zopfia rhizophila CBS 207.26 TaxID=1314779 RepID=A0A6A6E0L3_9PEZI|nr:cytochrome P450 [Zopfia rhizophila CBS 207.26]